MRPTARWRSILLIACATVSFAADSSLAVPIRGSIRFGDDEFSVEVRSTKQTLSIAARGCNNFDISLPADAPDSALTLVGIDNRTLATVAPGQLVESRTCGAERYFTELRFPATTVTTWTPVPDESRSARKVTYVASLSVAEIRFDPPVDLAIFDGTRQRRPVSVRRVAKIQRRGGTPIRFGADALHFRAVSGTIRRNGGFTSDDVFDLAAGTRPLVPPPLHHGTEIAFDASEERPATLSLYSLPHRPHVLAFFADEAQRTPTFVHSLRVNGVQALTPVLEVLRSDCIALERGPLDFLFAESRSATCSLVLSIGEPRIAVQNVRIESTDPSVLLVGRTFAGPYEAAIAHAHVPGAVPLEIPLRVHLTNAMPPGRHTVRLRVTGDGGLQRDVPLTVEIIDPFGRARTAALATLGAILAILLLRLLLQWHQSRRALAATRARFE